MTFLKEIYRIWITERPAQFAASLAYYGIFAFVPIIFIGLTVAGIFVDELSTAEQLYTLVADTLGSDAARMLEDALTSITESRTTGTVLSTVVSAIAMFSAASLMFFQLQFALNTIWGIPPAQRGETRAYVVKRLMSFVMVLGVGFFLIAATLISLVITAVTSFLDLDTAAGGLTLLASALLLTVALALIYKILPDASVSWRDVWVGSAVTALLITVGLKLLSFYLSRSSVGTALEAAGALAIFLLAFYILGQLLVFGAVFTRVFASMYGSKIVPDTLDGAADGAT